MSGWLAVALHDVEPRSFARCRQIRDWLIARGVPHVTLLVIPAADLHPIGARSPALSAWLRNRVSKGDSVAQHGLSHRAACRAGFPRRVLAGWQAGAAAEFPGLDHDDTVLRVHAGLKALRDIELDPRGFVAPGYAYTRALRDTLPGSFDWFADLHSVNRVAGRRLRAPALCLGTSTPIKRLVSPSAVQAIARSCGAVMRVDVHPADFDLPRHVTALDALLDRAGGREPVTYDQLLA